MQFPINDWRCSYRDDRARPVAEAHSPAIGMAAAALRVSRAMADEVTLRAFLNGQPSELSMALAQLDVARILLAEARDGFVPHPHPGLGFLAVDARPADEEAEP